MFIQKHVQVIHSNGNGNECKCMYLEDRVCEDNVSANEQREQDAGKHDKLCKGVDDESVQRCVLARLATERDSNDVGRDDKSSGRDSDVEEKFEQEFHILIPI